MTPEMPADLDREARKKWKELLESCDTDVDLELLANYCRQFSSLVAIRLEKARQIKSRTFASMVPGRDGALQLNPLLTGENRLIASQNRMLRTLGLAPSREEQGRRSGKAHSDPRPPGANGPEPACGWALEMALCGNDEDFLPGGKFWRPAKQ